MYAWCKKHEHVCCHTTFVITCINVHINMVHRELPKLAGSTTASLAAVGCRSNVLPRYSWSGSTVTTNTREHVATTA